MIRNIINFLVKFSQLLNFMANTLRFLSLRDEYYVYVPSNNKPRYIHTSYKSAHKEAQRLREKIDDTEYVEILQIIDRFNGYNLPF